MPIVATPPDELDIDGRLDETIWSELSPVALEPFGSGPELTSESHVFVTESHLYIGARLEDDHIWSTLETRDAQTWTEEVLELFVDPNGDGQNYLELQINPLGTIFDANFDVRLGTGSGSRGDQIKRAKAFDLKGLESAVHVEGSINDKASQDEFWSVELKIPLGALPDVTSEDIAPGDTWAVNLYRFDRPSKGSNPRSFAWSTRPRGDFHRVDKFGTFRFISPSDSN